MLPLLITYKFPTNHEYEIGICMLLCLFNTFIFPLHMVMKYTDYNPKCHIFFNSIAVNAFIMRKFLHTVVVLAIGFANFSFNHTHPLHAHCWIAHPCKLTVGSFECICTSVFTGHSMGV